MPIYAYRCAACGHAKDVLQKVSDPLLTLCPACGAQSFQKQLTSAGFQLKGSGWYVTDFKGDANSKKSAGGDAATKANTPGGEAAKGDAAKGDAAKGDSKASESSGAKSDSTAPASSKDSAKTAPPASSATPPGGTTPAAK
jgi:putative FmdB family regulatory protein